MGAAEGKNVVAAMLGKHANLIKLRGLNDDGVVEGGGGTIVKDGADTLKRR